MYSGGRFNITSREDACRYLGVKINATESEIKSAYRDLSKRYHPDVNSNPLANEYYVLVNNAYKYLEENPYIAPVVPVRQTKVFQTTSSVRKDFNKQKSMQEEHRRVKEWDAGRKQREEVEKAEIKKSQIKEHKSKEDEVLEKIRAIWLAETIRRQIEQDKIDKEAENKRKLYRAFMQQRMNETESILND